MTLVQPELEGKALKAALRALGRQDPDLARAIAEVGPPPPRSRPAGFASLLDIILAQQVSTHSYRAIDDEGATWSDSTGGFPGWLHWDADDYLGIAGVAVNDRYFLLAYGSHIPSLKALQTAAALMNLEGLKKQS